MQAYLTATEIIDYQRPKIQKLANELADSDKIATAKACFESPLTNFYP